MNSLNLLYSLLVGLIINLVAVSSQESGSGGEGGSSGGESGGESGGGSSGGGSGGSGSSSANIVIVFSDDLGWNDVGYNGATDCYTPNIDSLADNGLVLSHFYTHPKCAPSRAALLTGRHPFRYGFQHDSPTSHTIECGLDLTETLFSDRFQDNGYDTYMLGKWHLGFYQWDYTPNYRGFDTFAGYYGNQEDYYNYYYEESSGVAGVDFREDTTPYNASTTGEYAPDLYTLYMQDWLDGIEEPFLWYIAHQVPHSPVDVKNQYVKAVNTAKNYTSNPRKNYCSMIYAMDDSLGTIIDELESEGIWDNTWFFFISDNGPTSGVGSAYPLRGVKGTMFEGGIRTPAIVSGGLLPSSMQGKVLTESTSLIDVFATICSMADIDCSDLSFDGIDLYDYITGAASSLNRDYLLLGVDSVGCDTDEDVCGGIRYGDLKLVLGTELIGGGDDDYYWEINDLDNPSVGEGGITVDCSGGGSRPNVGTDLSWDCGYSDDPCLFNITADPCEYNDLSNDADYQQILTTMLAELESYYEDQVTPLQFACEYDAADANPSNHGGFWSPWVDSPNGYDGTDWVVSDSDSSGSSGNSGGTESSDASCLRSNINVLAIGVMFYVMHKLF